MPRPKVNAAEAARRRAGSLLLPKDGQSTETRAPVTSEPRLAVYERRSQATDTSVSMARQRKETERLIQIKDGRYDRATDWHYDDDVSARGGKYRPGLEKLLRLVMEGRYDGIVVYEIARLLRNVREARIVRDIFTEAGCDVYSVREPYLSLYGPAAFGWDMLVSTAAGESQTISDRITSFIELVQPMGAVRGPISFGLVPADSDKYVEGRKAPLRMPVPDEQPRAEYGDHSPAELLRDAADRFLAGESLSVIVGTWNRAGYPSPRGTVWTRQSLRKTLLSPSMVGYAHKAGVLYDVTGQLLTPDRQADEDDDTAEPLRVGPGVLTDATWHALRAKLTPGTQRRARTDSLLRGLLRCGRCGSGMGRNGKAYVCTYRYESGQTGCAGNAIHGERTDQLVLAAVHELLSFGDVLAAGAALNAPAARGEAADLETRVAQLDRQLEDLEQMWLDTEVKDARAKARFDRHRRRLAAQLTEASAKRAALAAQVHRPNLERLAVSAELTPAGAFLAAPRHEQTSVMYELIAGITIGPAARSGREGGFQPYNPERVDIRWAV